MPEAREWKLLRALCGEATVGDGWALGPLGNAPVEPGPSGALHLDMRPPGN